MSARFSKQVEFGLKLSKRIYYGRTGSMSAPQPPIMDDSSEISALPNLPTAPMAYAVIKEPSVVDNPDIPSYQPHVHGPCLPPALIPLHMHGIAMEVDCYLDTAFFTVTGTWRVHCVKSSKTCQCLIAIPFGDQGSVLGVEIDTGRKSYYTQLIAEEDGIDAEEASKCNDGWLLKCQTYMLTIPKVDGGSYLSVKIKWSKKLVYQNGEFGLTVPFSYPAYVMPVAKKVVLKEKILLNVNAGTGTEVLCKNTSHPLKQVRHGVGQLGFVYDEEVLRWSTTDFTFSYSVASSNIFGGLVLRSPSLNDFDQRETFYFYLYPGNNHMKVFRKEVVFVIDISASMQGRPIQNIKEAVTSALLKLNPTDSFNVLAFNEGTQLFSSSMEFATDEMIEKATQWMDTYFVAGGGTNMLIPLNKALDMVAKTTNAIPIIFLVTDGAVEDEREICNVMKGRLSSGGINSPRICTFGIGLYCNHYLLQILAQTGRGRYDAAYDVGSINVRMQRLVQNALSLVLANIRIDALEHVDSLELYPSQFPDLSSGSPLIASGRYHGEFPEIVKVSGILADFNTFHMDVKIQNAKSFPTDTVFAKSQIDTLTAQAWLSGSKQLQEKVAKLSIQTGFPSEYTRLVFVHKTDKVDVESELDKTKVDEANGKKMILLRHLGLGFGNLTATLDNLRPGEEDEAASGGGLIMNAASTYCSKMLDMCCCMCFIRSCSRLNDQCSIAITQLCSALACFTCLNCCIEFCSSCD